MFRHRLDVPPAELVLVDDALAPQLAGVLTTATIAWHVLRCRGPLRDGETVAVVSITSGLGTVVDCVGETLPFSHRLLATTGRLVSVGTHDARSAPLDVWRLFTREQDPLLALEALAGADARLRTSGRLAKILLEL